MSKACPILPPEERQAAEILKRIMDEMVRQVDAVLVGATEQARLQLNAAGLSYPASQQAFFASVIHQRMYCTLCGADPETLTGGNPQTALSIIRNSQMLAKHHWGADIENLSQSAVRATRDAT
jgi:hypothetical protein